MGLDFSPFRRHTCIPPSFASTTNEESTNVFVSTEFDFQGETSKEDDAPRGGGRRARAEEEGIIAPLFSQLGLGVARCAGSSPQHGGDGARDTSFPWKQLAGHDLAATEAAVLAVRDALGKTALFRGRLPPSQYHAPAITGTFEIAGGTAGGGRFPGNGDASLVVRISLGVPPPSLAAASSDRSSSSASTGAQLALPRKVNLEVVKRSVPFEMVLLRPMHVSLGGLAIEGGDVCVVAAVTVGYHRRLSRRAELPPHSFLRATGMLAAGRCYQRRVELPTMRAPAVTMHPLPVGQWPPSAENIWAPKNHALNTEDPAKQINRNRWNSDCLDNNGNADTPGEQQPKKMRPTIYYAMNRRIELEEGIIDVGLSKSVAWQEKHDIPYGTEPSMHRPMQALPAQAQRQKQLQSHQSNSQEEVKEVKQVQASSLQAGHHEDSAPSSASRQCHPPYVDHINEIPMRAELDQFEELILSLKTPPFPICLQRLLDGAAASSSSPPNRWSTDQHQHQPFGWLSHGRAFRVYDVDAFVGSVLPQHFRLTKYCSFLRQLNLYGFRRITMGPDRGAYYHECFLRGRPVLASCMRRTRVNGNGRRMPDDPDTEPDFAKYPAMPPVAASLHDGGGHMGGVTARAEGASLGDHSATAHASGQSGGRLLSGDRGNSQLLMTPDSP